MTGLEPHPSSSSLWREKRILGLEMHCLKPCPSLLLSWQSGAVVVVLAVVILLYSVYQRLTSLGHSFVGGDVVLG